MQRNEITEAMRSEDFVNSILDMQTPEEVQEAFKEKGVEISFAEIETIESIINKMVEKNSTELSDEDLRAISGGLQSEQPGGKIMLDLSGIKPGKIIKKANWFKKN